MKVFILQIKQNLLARRKSLFLFLLPLLFFPKFLLAGEEVLSSSPILIEYRSGIEQYRNLIHHPPFQQADPGLLYAKYHSALNDFQQGDGYTAIQTLQGLLDSKKTSEDFKHEIHLTLGFMFLEQKRPQQALREFTAVESEPDLREKAWYGIAFSFLQMEEYVKAITLFEDLVKNYPDGDYAPESLSRIGFCYFKILAFENAIESYKKALHYYNQKIEEQKEFLKKAEPSLPFDSGFIFHNSDSQWSGLFTQIREDPDGYEMLHLTSEFLEMEKQQPPEIQQGLLQIKNKIRSLFHEWMLNRVKQRQQALENLSIQAAIGIAKNMVLAKSDLGKGRVSP